MEYIVKKVPLSPREITVSNEIRVGIRVDLVNGELKESLNLSDTMDQSLAELDAGDLTIGTSEEDVVFTDVTTAGLLVLKNVDAAGVTNTVRYGPKSAGAMVRFGLLSTNARFGCIYLDGSAPVTLRMQAIGGDVKVQFWVLGQ